MYKDTIVCVYPHIHSLPVYACIHEMDERYINKSTALISQILYPAFKQETWAQKISDLQPRWVTSLRLKNKPHSSSCAT